MAEPVQTGTELKLNAGRYAGIAAAGLTAGIARNYRNLTKQNSPFRRYWERHLEAMLASLTERVEAGGPMPLVYVAFGDSAAQGLGARSVFEGYVPRLAVALEAMSGREVVLLNLSLSGGTAHSVLNTQIPQLRGLRVAGQPITPDVVTLDIGGNDVLQPWMTEAGFAGLIEKIADGLPAGSFLMNIPSFGVMKAETKAAALSGSIEEAAGRAGHYLVDIRTVSVQMPMWEYMAAYHAVDLFHPSSPWYAVWAQKFADAVADANGWEHVDVAELGTWSGPISAP